MALPGWLAIHFARSDSRFHPGTDRLLEDVLWGQYALFVALRMQDDLFDRQADSRSLIFAPDLFIAESAKCFAGLCGDIPAFWDLYGDCTARTVRAILEVEILQKAGECPVDALLEKYAEVNSIFKVGSAAVCLLADGFDQFSAVSQFCDEIAKVAQIYDDIEDVTADLADGRMNYVARRIGLSVGDQLDEADLLAKIESWLHDEVKTMRLVSEMRIHIACAEEAIAPLNLPGVNAYCRREWQAVDVVEQTLLTSSAIAIRNELFRPGGIVALLSRPALPVWTV
ncbi:MAG TPA: hypothetical protein VL126_03620 [Bacteroidota bacterium]|nr:hypothetical protein [Bacteroidota bacterium]